MFKIAIIIQDYTFNKQLKIRFAISSLLIFIIANSAICQSTIEPNSILIGADQINTVNGDTILFWNKGRNAFRGGSFDASQILNVNVGQNSFAYGFKNESQGTSSASIGSVNKATGDASIAMGAGNIAERAYSIALGYQNKAFQQESVAIGNNNEVNYAQGVALGEHLIVNNQSMIAVGTYNQELPTTQNWLLRPIFVVGNGDGRDIGRRNAMTILFDGRTGFNTSSPVSDVHIVHKDNSTHAGLRLENENMNGKWWRFYTRSQTDELALYNNSFMSGTSAVGEFNTSGSYSGPSDRRLKKDIVDLPYGLNEVLQLSPKRYQFKHVEDRQDIGLIAQEVLEVIPELVSYDKTGDKYMLNYDGFGVLSIKAIQELHEVVEEQSTTIKDQQAIIDDLIQRVQHLEKSKKF